MNIYEKCWYWLVSLSIIGLFVVAACSFGIMLFIEEYNEQKVDNRISYSNDGAI